MFNNIFASNPSFNSLQRTSRINSIYEQQFVNDDWQVSAVYTLSFLCANDKARIADALKISDIGIDTNKSETCATEQSILSYCQVNVIKVQSVL